MGLFKITVFVIINVCPLNGAAHNSSPDMVWLMCLAFTDWLSSRKTDLLLLCGVSNTY